MLRACNLIHRRMSDFTIHPVADTIGATGPLLSRRPAPAAPARAKLESLTTAIGPPNSPPRDELLAAISPAGVNQIKPSTDEFLKLPALRRHHAPQPRGPCVRRPQTSGEHPGAPSPRL